jgi:hypothetical protein
VTVPPLVPVDGSTLVQVPDISFIYDSEAYTYSAKLCRQLFEYIDIDNVVAIIFDPVHDEITRVNLASYQLRPMMSDVRLTRYELVKLILLVATPSVSTLRLPKS